MGISMMGRGSVGSTIDPDSFIARQKLADELYKNSMAAPQTPELSWTQGAARLAQSLASGYESAQLNKDRDTYKQQRQADMQMLGNAISTGDYKSVMGQLSDPESQRMAFGLAQTDNMARARSNGNMQLAMLKNSLQNKDSTEKFTQQIALKKADHALKRDDYLYERGDKLTDKNDERTFDIKKMGVANNYDRDKLAYSSELENNSPIKATQLRYAEFARLASDEDAPPELRSFASGQMEGLQKNIAAMSPPKTSVSVDTGAKAEAAGDIQYNKKRADIAIENEDAIKKQALAAPDMLSKMEIIQNDITAGKLTNLNLTDAGTNIERYSARLGMDNNSAAISTYMQTAGDMLIDARKELAKQGAISDFETRTLEKTRFLPNDTTESILAKIHLFKQVYNRQQKLGELTNEWNRRYGGTYKPAPNGATFQTAVTNLIKQTPLTSLEDEEKAKQEAASQNVAR